MNYIKAQEHIFKALIRGERVCRFDVDEENTFITPDGFRGWFFPNSVLMLDTEKIAVIKPVETVSLIKPANKINMTLDFKLMSSHAKAKDLLRKFDGKQKPVWVKESFLGFFNNPSFYQNAEEPLSHIVVTEKVRGAVKPVGIVLPTRINNEPDV